MFYCDKEFIGKVIQTFRKNANIKQSELAEKTGISEKHLSKIETGKNFPSLDNFLKMAEVLSFKLSDFGIETQEGFNKENELKKALFKKISYASDEKLSFYLKTLDTLDEILEKRSKN